MVFHVLSQHDWESGPVFSASHSFHAVLSMQRSSSGFVVFVCCGVFCLFFLLFIVEFLCICIVSELPACFALVMRSKHSHHPGYFSGSCWLLPCLMSYQELNSFNKCSERYQSVPQLARVASAVARGKETVSKIACWLVVLGWCAPGAETAWEKDLREAEPFLGPNSVRIRSSW